jgi:hypothetical protein
MDYTVSSTQELFIYALGALAVAFLAFIGVATWRQGTRLERAIPIIAKSIGQGRGLSSAAGMPAPAKSAATAAPQVAAQPSTRAARHEGSDTTDADPVHSRTSPPDDAEPAPALDPYVALHEVNGAGDPLALLRMVESELAALGALAEAARPGEGAEFLDVSGALGPTLSLAARRIGVAVDLLELRPAPPSEPVSG